jgi:DnaJ-class molecular chaperone
MSCDVCFGYPGCPVCSDPAEYRDCEDCNGNGHLYFNSNGVELTPEAAERGEKTDTIKDECSTCKGEGRVLIEKEEPDYAY